MQRILSAVAGHARRRPAEVAVRDADGHEHRWSGIEEGMRRVHAWAAAACPPGAFVAVSLSPGGAAWQAILGTARAGRVPVLLPARLAPSAAAMVRACIGDAPSIDDASWDQVRSTAPTAEQAAEPPGLVLLSSGTTGRSRLVRRGAAAIDRVAETLVSAGMCSPDDRVVSCLPMTHAFGLEHALLAPALAGACVRVVERFGVEQFAAELSRGATALLLVPATADLLAEASPVAPHLRQATVAGAPLPARVRARFEAWRPGTLVDLYGASELGTIWLDRGQGGIPVPGVEVRIVDPEAPDALHDVPAGTEGEVAVRSDAMLAGVLGAGGAVEPIDHAGFVRTGDIGVRTALGFRLLGRTKLVFDVGGLKVNPVEVEEALCSLPEVRAAVVGPMPVTDTLSRVVARVELREGVAPPDASAMRAALERVLPAHAVPRSIEFVPSLPRTASGKILRVHPEPAPAPEGLSPVLRRPDGLEDRGARESWTQRLFDRTADGYDHSSGAAFLRVGRWYRRRMLVNVGGLGPGGAHLDVGSGTGLCAALAQRIVGPAGRVVALDPSGGMLAVARRRGVRETVQGRAECLPFDERSFDVVSMSYMLRHVDDLVQAFREAHRVLRPGGRIVVFEVTNPPGGASRAAFRAAMHWLVPAVGVVASLRPSTFPMMRYWARTIDDAVPPERIVGAMRAAGFVGARHGLELGVFSCYRGVRAPS